LTKFSAQLFRNNMYKNVVVLCCGVLGYDTLVGGYKTSGEVSVWEFKVEV
jgi:hypothetical protein